MALHDPHPVEVSPGGAKGATRATPPRTFGRYLLFKRLKRDALGELHRAGQLGADAVERVVALRLFNGAGIDGQDFWRACRERLELRSTLRGGPFGEVVDSGCERGVAFVAHEFVFGRSLAELLAEAREQSHPVPLEHTLHIMDRVAIGLHSAYETRLDERRVVHGFLIPDFVQLSSEGEVRLTGFESTGGLLELDAGGPARAALAGYLSPEVNAGEAPRSSDDVYSLGAIFGELLTGEPLPALNPSESSRWVDAATLGADGAPLPDKLRHLLRESLLPRDQRIRTAEQWHRTLVEIAPADGQTSTTFDVAFFMHTLFGQELEREAELVEAEMRSEVPAPRPVEAVAEPEPPPDAAPAVRTEAPNADLIPAPNADPMTALDADLMQALNADPIEAPTAEPMTAHDAGADPVGAPDAEPEAAFDSQPLETFGAEPAPDADPIEATRAEPGDAAFGAPAAPSEPITPAPARPPTTQSGVQSAPAPSSAGKWIAVAAGAVVVAGLGAGYFLFGKGSAPGREAAAARTVAPAPRPEEPAPATEPAASEDVLQGISELPPPLSPEELESQVRSLVAERAGDLQADLKAEYDQRLLELRRQLEEARQAQAAALEAAAAVEPATEPETADPAPEPRLPTRAAPEEPALAAAPPPAVEAAAPRAQPEPAAPPARTPAEPIAAPAPRPTPEPERRAEPDPAPGPSSVAPATAAEPAPVERGSIVPNGPGVTPPRLLSQPRAVYPPAAIRLKRQATIRLRILVDEQGEPSQIEQMGKKVGLGFDGAALKAARTARWSPPEKDGVPVKMWVELSIDFRP